MSVASGLPLHGRSRAAVHPATEAAADRRGGPWPEVGAPGRSDRGRLHHDRSGSGPTPHVPPGGRPGQAQLRRGDSLLAKKERDARRTAHEVWALAALEGSLFTEIAQPAHFEAAFKPITEEQVANLVVCGPDPARHLEAIRKASRAGYDHVCVHQIGPDQEGFVRFYEADVLPGCVERSVRGRSQLSRKRAA